MACIDTIRSTDRLQSSGLRQCFPKCRGEQISTFAAKPDWGARSSPSSQWRLSLQLFGAPDAIPECESERCRRYCVTPWNPLPTRPDGGVSRAAKGADCKSEWTKPRTHCYRLILGFSLDFLRKKDKTSDLTPR